MKPRTKIYVSTTLNVLGNIWLVLGCILILVGLVGILITDGFWKLAETLSPFNIINYIVTILILVPDIAMKILSEKLLNPPDQL